MISQEQKEEFILNEFSRKGYEMTNIIDKTIVNIVYNIFLDGIIPANIPENGELYLYIGSYYHINGDYQNMMKYYLMAIEKNNHTAMNNLGYYYRYILKDYDNMMKYYKMAVQAENTVALLNIGSYYSDIKDYDKMKKYYDMAIEYDNKSAVRNMNFYLQTTDDVDYAILHYKHLDLLNKLKYAPYFELIEEKYIDESCLFITI